MTATLMDLVTPEGVLILPSNAPHEVWKQSRRLGIGGSDALPSLGLSQYGSRYTVWADKSGLLPEVDDNEAMKWGRRLEPVIAEAFIEETGIDAFPCGLMRHVDRSWQVASVDRLTSDAGVLEIKTTSAYKAMDWDDDQIADHAEAQLQHYLAVTGLEHGYAAALIGGQRLEIRHVVRNERLISLIIDAEQELWELVQAGTAPALDGSAATSRALGHLHPCADDGHVDLDDQGMAALRRYDELGKQIKDLTKQRNQAKNEVCALLGDEETGRYNDFDVVTWRNTSTFDQDAFTEDHPHLAAEFTASVTVEQLDRLALAAAHPVLFQAYRGRRFNSIRKAL